MKSKSLIETVAAAVQRIPSAKAREFARAVYGCLKLRSADLRQLRYFLVFIGNPRSGTTIVRSLLNGHPNAVISNEIHALRHVANGESWKRVAGRILANADRFAQNPTWRGYSYHVAHRASRRRPPIHMLGDKKAGAITLLVENPQLLPALLDWSPVPIRFLHCVRHPLDVIATRSRRNGLSLKQNVMAYFDTEAGTSQFCRILGTQRFRRIYLERLIEKPRPVMAETLDFLELAPDDDYLDACQQLTYDRPNRSRGKNDWPAEIRNEVEEKTRELEHLRAYMQNDRLMFDEEPRQRICQTDRPAA